VISLLVSYVSSVDATSFITLVAPGVVRLLISALIKSRNCMRSYALTLHSSHCFLVVFTRGDWLDEEVT